MLNIEQLKRRYSTAYVHSGDCGSDVLTLCAEVEKWRDLVKTFSAGNVALEAEVERLEARAVLLEQTLADLLHEHEAHACQCIPCQVLHGESYVS